MQIYQWKVETLLAQGVSAKCLNQWLLTNPYKYGATPRKQDQTTPTPNKTPVVVTK